MRNLEEVAAGYLLVRPMPRPSFVAQELLPETIVSASQCICPQFPDTSAIDWVRASEEIRARALDAVGLRVERRGDARAWATAEFGTTFGWPGVFYTAAGASEARQRFLGNESSVEVIGLGLPHGWIEEFIAYASPPPPEPGFSAQGESGYLQTVKRRDPLAAGSKRLGFELVNVEVGQLGHSWLCNGLETHCANTVGVRPGANGLIETLASAERCRNEIAREEVGAEPGLWLPWLLVRYP